MKNSKNVGVLIGKTAEISDKIDKKTFSLKDNISQSGGSVLQAMQNLLCVTEQDGKVQLRGNDKQRLLRNSCNKSWVLF